MPSLVFHRVLWKWMKGPHGHHAPLIWDHVDFHIPIMQYWYGFIFMGQAFWAIPNSCCKRDWDAFHAWNVGESSEIWMSIESKSIAHFFWKKNPSFENGNVLLVYCFLCVFGNPCVFLAMFLTIPTPIWQESSGLCGSTGRQFPWIWIAIFHQSFVGWIWQLWSSSRRFSAIFFSKTSFCYFGMDFSFGVFDMVWNWSILKTLGGIGLVLMILSRTELPGLDGGTRFSSSSSIFGSYHLCRPWGHLCWSLFVPDISHQMAGEWTWHFGVCFHTLIRWSIYTPWVPLSVHVA